MLCQTAGQQWAHAVFPDGTGFQSHRCKFRGFGGPGSWIVICYTITYLRRKVIVLYLCSYAGYLGSNFRVMFMFTSRQQTTQSNYAVWQTDMHFYGRPETGNSNSFAHIKGKNVISNANTMFSRVADTMNYLHRVSAAFRWKTELKQGICMGNVLGAHSWCSH
jgi:hypothetical protein